MRIALPIVLTLLAACSLPASTKSEDSSKPSGGTSKPAGGGDTAKPAATEDSAAVAGPPEDPLDDSGKPQAACDDIKLNGLCVEHFNLGFGEDSAKTMCESTGKWTKGGTCPKENRIGVCRTTVDRAISYKGQGVNEAEQPKFCADIRMGKWAAAPKGK